MKEEKVQSKSDYALEKNWRRPEYPWRRLSDNARGWMDIRKDGVYFIPAIKADQPHEGTWSPDGIARIPIVDYSKEGILICRQVDSLAG